jgi:hypothetical protein
MRTVETTIHRAPFLIRGALLRSPWPMSVSTLIIGGLAFAAGPMLWPISPSVPPPPSRLLPGYIARLYRDLRD